MRGLTGIVAAALLVVTAALLAWGIPPAELTLPPSDIKFSHLLHVEDAGLECAQCHAAPESQSSADKLFPTMDVCEDCHAIDDDEECGICHRNPEEPEASPDPDRAILFNHKRHLDLGHDCDFCHAPVAQSEQASRDHLPDKTFCMSCHDDTQAPERCVLCHGDQLTLVDIHPTDWRHAHGDRAASDPDWCATCHPRQEDCLACHRGDNLQGEIHELNYAFTHGLDANAKTHDCARCHDREEFCNACHEGANRIPLLHSSLGWLPNHGRAAQSDIENCASCHDSGDPTCARGGCHSDFDGVRGTDPPLHPGDLSRFDREGPWHDDAGFFCFQCHDNTDQAGIGFCGYCHGAEENGGGE